MATITTALTYDVTNVGNYKQASQAFASAILSLGWLSSNDFGALSATNNFGSGTITNISASAGVVTVTFSTPTGANYAIGAKILITGVTTNTVLNNTYQVITTLPSTTTFTFAFAGTITNGADTGTATMTYGFATLTGPPDKTAGTGGSNSSDFALGGFRRFRGAYVATTGTFTNLQVTNNLTLITVATPHGLDQTRALGQSLNISAVANANFTYLNTNPGSATTGTNGWPITAITQLTITVNTGSSPRADVASTAVSAGSGAPQYQINNTPSQNPSYDTCTYQGDMYGVTTNSGVQNFNSTPGTTGGSVTGFRRYSFDIFTTNDTLSSTNKLYFQILYGANNTTASGTATPSWVFYIGAATDGAGNITTNYNWPIVGGTLPFSPMSGAATNTQTAVWETNISGTSGRLSVILWRGFTGTASFLSAPTTILVLDRSKDNSGNDTDAYWTIAFSGSSSASTGGAYQQSVAKPGAGGAGIGEWTISQAVALSPIRVVNIIGGQQGYNNQLPFSPVFPILGFVGNPLLGAIGMKNGDTSEGALVNATLYGTTHPYLMTIKGGAQVWGPNGNNAAGIRWE